MLFPGDQSKIYAVKLLCWCSVIWNEMQENANTIFSGFVISCLK